MSNHDYNQVNIERPTQTHFLIHSEVKSDYCVLVAFIFIFDKGSNPIQLMASHKD